MAINVGQYQQNVHLYFPNQECKGAIGTILGGLYLLIDDGWLSEIIVIVDILFVVVVVPNNIWILETYHLPIDTSFYLLVTSLQGAICCHQHHSVLWILHSTSMKVLAINYSIYVIIIAYLLPIKVLLHHLSVNIIWTVPPFYHPCQKTPNLDQFNDLP